MRKRFILSLNKSARPLHTNKTQLGKSIETLKEDLSLFFDRGPRLQVYSSDVVFSDPFVTGFRIKGKIPYFLMLQLVKGVAQGILEHKEFSLVSFERVPEDELVGIFNFKNAVRIRWILMGQTRRLLGHRLVQYEGVFLYGFNDSGFISEHVLIHMHPHFFKKLIFT